MLSLWLPFLFTPVAFGLEISDTGGCPGLQLLEHRPSAGAVDIPPDARLSLVFQPGGCGGASVQIFVESDQDEHGSEELYIDQTTGLAHWAPEEGWQTGATYTVTVFDEVAREEGRTFSFSAGDEEVELIDDLPVVMIYELRGVLDDWGGGVVDLDLHVSHQSDPQGLTLVQVADSADLTTPITTKFGVGTGELEVAARLVQTEATDEVCLRAWQVDAAGGESDVGDEVCGEVVWEEAAGMGCTGCSSGAGVMGVGFVWCVMGCLIALRREEAESSNSASELLSKQRGA